MVPIDRLRDLPSFCENFIVIGSIYISFIISAIAFEQGRFRYSHPFQFSQHFSASQSYDLSITKLFVNPKDSNPVYFYGLSYLMIGSGISGPSSPLPVDTFSRIAFG
jgi:hypothetical protein